MGSLLAKALFLFIIYLDKIWCVLKNININMKILAIETSCDETAIALLEANARGYRVLANLVSSQINIHKKYGGIVPEVAARKHAEVMPILLNQALGRHQTSDIRHQIDVIAVTAGPGLITSLLVGVETAKTLAVVWNKPIVPVNHIEGHILSVKCPMVYQYQMSKSKCQVNSKIQMPNISHQQMNKSTRSSIFPGPLPRASASGAGELRSSNTDLRPSNPRPRTTNYNKWQDIKFPAIALVVSGGHTQLILMKKIGQYKIIGETLDDAVGEAFDKVAKILDLGYPGGPVISKLGTQAPRHPGTQSGFEFARPMINRQDFNFSFSGIKTSVLYFTQEQKRLTEQLKAEICLEFEKAVVDVLVTKTIRAAQKFSACTVMLGGGVAANARLRNEMQKTVNEKLAKVDYLSPNIQLATDNALMIAVAGYFRATQKRFVPYSKIKVDPNWRVDSL
jgi:N6-L-threonylcarbamoyladenine synthase